MQSGTFQEHIAFFKRTFMDLSLKFMSLIHFDFIFVYGMEKYFDLILLYILAQFSQRHLLKRLPFFHYIFLPPLS